MKAIFMGADEQEEEEEEEGEWREGEGGVVLYENMGVPAPKYSALSAQFLYQVFTHTLSLSFFFALADTHVQRHRHINTSKLCTHT